MSEQPADIPTLPVNTSAVSPAVLAAGDASGDRAADGVSPAVRYLVPLTLCAALALRLLGLNKGLWMDETYSIRTISTDSLLGMIRAMRLDNQSPLYFVVLRIWALLGTSEFMLRMLSVVLGIAAVVSVAYWMKRYSPSAALFAALVMSTFPLLLRYSQEVRPYAFLLLATALAFYCASRVIAEPGRHIWYLALAASLITGVMVHLVGVFLLIPVGLFILVRNPRWRGVPVMNVLLVSVSFIAVFCLVRYYYLKGVESVTQNWWMSPISLSLFARTLRDASAMTSLPGQPDGSTADLLLRGGIVLSTAVLGVTLLFGDWKRSLPFSVAALAYWLELIGYSLVQTPVFWDRTALPGLVPFSGFVGLQMVTIQKRGIRYAAIGALVLLSCCFATRWAASGAFKPIEETKALSGLLESKRQNQDPVVIYPDYYKVPLLYYAPGIPAHAVISVPVGSSLAGFGPALHNALAGRPTGEQSLSLFLVIRSDLLSERDSVTCDRLIRIVGSHRSEAPILHLFVIISSEARRETIERLRSVFGQPAFTRDYGTFMYALYESRVVG